MKLSMQIHTGDFFNSILKFVILTLFFEQTKNSRLMALKRMGIVKNYEVINAIYS